MKNKTFTFKNGKSITLELFSSVLECGVFIFISAITSLMTLCILMKYAGPDMERTLKEIISNEISSQMAVVDSKRGDKQ